MEMVEGSADKAGIRSLPGSRQPAGAVTVFLFTVNITVTVTGYTFRPPSTSYTKYL